MSSHVSVCMLLQLHVSVHVPHMEASTHGLAFLCATSCNYGNYGNCLATKFLLLSFIAMYSLDLNYQTLMMGMMG